MLKIVRLTPEDLGLFRKLFIRIFDEGFGYYPQSARQYILKTWSPEKVAAKLPGKNRLFLLAFKDSLPAGFLIGKCYSTGTCSILWVGVLKSFRGQGIGSKLVATWEKWGRKMGAKRFRAATTNPENEKFYTKLEYKKSPKGIKNDWGMDLIVFLKSV